MTAVPLDAKIRCHAAI